MDSSRYTANAWVGAIRTPRLVIYNYDEREPEYYGDDGCPIHDDRGNDIHGERIWSALLGDLHPLFVIIDGSPEEENKARVIKAQARLGLTMWEELEAVVYRYWGIPHNEQMYFVNNGHVDHRNEVSTTLIEFLQQLPHRERSITVRSHRMVEDMLRSGSNVGE